MSDPLPRPTVRAVLLDAEERVLLQRYHDPSVYRPGAAPHAAPVWIAPGGGVEAGEELAGALEREVFEETGLTGVSWGAWLWRRRVNLHYQGAVRAFDEHYRLGRVARAAPSVHPQRLAEHETSVLKGHRWWRWAALDRSRETIYPVGLATLLIPVLAGVTPAAPLELSD